LTNVLSSEDKVDSTNMKIKSFDHLEKIVVHTILQCSISYNIIRSHY